MNGITQAGPQGTATCRDGITLDPNGITSLSSLQQDARNANRGTARGLGVLRDSLERLGAGRSIVLDRDGRIIAGNKTARAAALAGLDDVIVVKTDGTKVVAVQRTDLGLDSPEGRELALADNRAGELGLSWDADVLAEIQGSVDLSGLFTGAEIDALLGELSKAPAPTLASGSGGERVGVPECLTGRPAGSEAVPAAAPAPGKASPADLRAVGPQGAPAVPPLSQPVPSVDAAATRFKDFEFKEFDEAVADGVTVRQCPACGNRWAE